MALKGYNDLIKKIFSGEDYENYMNFKVKAKHGFDDNDLRLVYRLHAKYFKHPYNEPCGCGGARKMDTIMKWIKDLDKIYTNGMETKKS